MLLGIFAGFFVLFFLRLTYRRVHAKRCDQYLGPLARLQAELLKYWNATNKNNKNKRQTTTEDDEEKKKDAADALEEVPIPVLTIMDVYSACRDCEVPPADDEENSKAATTSNNNNSNNANPLFTLDTVHQNLQASPTITVSFAGQRVVWTRSPSLMRRVLLTHFRMYPGPPTKQVMKAELSSYGSSAITSSSFIALFVQRENQNHISSNNQSAASSSHELATRFLLSLADGERTWDHVTWQGGFKPGEMPDIPGLLLRGMASRKQQGRDNDASSSSSTAGVSKPFLNSTAIQMRKQRLSALFKSARGDLDQLAESVVKTILVDVVGDAAFREVEWRYNSEVNQRRDLKSGGDDALLVDPTRDSNNSNSTTNNNSNLTTAAASSASSSSSSSLWAADVAGIPLFVDRLSDTEKQRMQEQLSSMSKPRDLLLSACYSLGLSPFSWLVSWIANTRSHARNSKQQFACASSYQKLHAGMRVCVEKQVDSLTAAMSGSKQKQQQQLSHADEAATVCGLSVVLQNCGSTVVFDSSKANANRASSRWDPLLRETIADKTSVVVVHLTTIIFDVVCTVLQRFLTCDTGSGSSNNSSSKNSELKPLQSMLARIRSPETSDNDRSFLVECFVREALRLKPAVTRAVRYAENDDPQRADVFGIAPSLVQKVCGVGLVADASSSDDNKAGKQQQQLPPHVAHKKKMEEQEKATKKAMEEKLDPSIRLSNSGFLCVPSTAVVVCDILEMMRHPDTWAKEADPLMFCPQRWESAATTWTGNGAPRKQELDAHFAPFGFGAAAEMATRYVIATATDLVREFVVGE